jgi:hypothetical protein
MIEQPVWCVRKIAALSGLLLMGLLVAAAAELGAEEIAAADLKAAIFVPGPDLESGLIVEDYALHGYTNHWVEHHGTHYRYGGLLAGTIAQPRNEIAAIEDQIRTQLLLEELWVQRGFVAKLVAAQQRSAECRPMLMVGTDRDENMGPLLAKLPEWARFQRNRAFWLKQDKEALFVVCCHTTEEAQRLSSLVSRTVDFVLKYKMYKGISGYSTNYFSLSGLEGNPLDVIARALKLRYSWILLSGYNDWMTSVVAKDWLHRIDTDYVFEAGQYGKDCVMYGMKQYPPVQENTLEECLQWTRAHNGTIFGQLKLSEKKLDLDGYLVGAGDQDKIEALGKPFLAQGGGMAESVPASMVVLLEPEAQLSEETVLKALMERRCVALFPRGQMVGPREYVEALSLLMLDRVYLEQEFAEGADVAATVQDEILTVTICNRRGQVLRGEVTFALPVGLVLGDGVERMPVTVDAGGSCTVRLPIHYTTAAAGRTNPIGVSLDWNENHWKTVTYLAIPNSVEIHRLLLAQEGKVSFPISVWNCGMAPQFEVELQVYQEKDQAKPVLTKKILVDAAHAAQATLAEEMTLKAGRYVVRARALGQVAEGIISVRPAAGQAQVRLQDLDGDGTDEIVMENDEVRATILRIGGRVIEYILKSRAENLLFKLWPETPPLEGKPGGRRQFYPYGGLEEFIGQPTIETHIVFDYEILEASGPRVRVKVWANIHGNRVEKIITLGGEGTVLEVQYAFRNMDQSLNIIGINPLVEMGPSTGPEDVYYFPVAGKMKQRRPQLKQYYGSLLFTDEGWCVGEDTEMKVALAVAYPVQSALFMHYWSNHPNNTPTPYFYTELQPWLRIKHGTTTYFTYYLLGHDGGWQEAAQKLRELGLVTRKK